MAHAADYSIKTIVPPHHSIYLGIFILPRQHVHGDSIWFGADSIYSPSFLSPPSTSICALPLKKFTVELYFFSFRFTPGSFDWNIFFDKIFSNWKLL
jgi:hypothetical protein